jgi:hypothetical protein
MVQSAKVDFPKALQRRLSCLLIDVIAGEFDDVDGAIALIEFLLNELKGAKKIPESAHKVG